MNSPTSLLFIFTYANQLNDSQKERILNQVTGFLSQWKAHDAPLLAEATLEESRFLIISVDPSLAVPSGCSKDRLQHFVQKLNENENLNLAPAHLFFAKIGGKIQGLSKKEIGQIWKNDVQSNEYQLFPTWISNQSEFSSNWGKTLEHFAPVLNLAVEKPTFNK